VKLEINTSTFDADPVFCAQFNLVILVDQNFDVVNQANLTCRERGIAYVNLYLNSLYFTFSVSLPVVFSDGLATDFSTSVDANF
jgi:hypothetical protein